jgi:hypothetical protein
MTSASKKASGGSMPVTNDFWVNPKVAGSNQRLLHGVGAQRREAYSLEKTA